MAEKAGVRQRVSAQRRALTTAQVQHNSQTIARRITECSEYAAATCILLYHAFDNEVDLSDIVTTALAQGKRVLFPRCIRNSHELEVCSIADPAQELVRSSYGIMEPVSGLDAFTEYEKIDIVIVPGVAFDKTGHRLGRGAGYYDRFLAQLQPETIKIGVAFTCQIIDDLPYDAHDIKMNMIVTEDSLQYCPRF